MAERTLGWVADDSHHVKIPESVEGKKATRMVVTLAPPSHAAVGEEIRFEGYLEDVNGNKLAGKKLVWHVESAGDVGEFDYPTPDGTWSFRVTPTVTGSITQYVYFEGDAYYAGSRTPTYTTVTP